VRRFLVLVAALSLSLASVLGGVSSPRAEALTSYSRFSYGMRPFAERNAYDSDGWGTTCPASDLLGYASFDGGRVKVRKKLVPLVTLLMKITEQKYGYNIRGGETGGYSCRTVRGGSGLSNHGRGLAVDINWTQNPQSYTFRSTIPTAVVMLWVNHGFNWGGYYSYPTKFDAMHFEFADGPDDVAAYVTSAQAVLAGTKSVPAVQPCPALLPSSFATLKYGATGSNVIIAQCLLLRAGYGVRTDGSYGSGTRSVVNLFRAKLGWSKTGYLTQRTWVALEAYGTKTTVKYGSTGANVTRLQMALRSAGYTTVPVNGVFDSATRTAVRTYQSRCELEVDGIVGSYTWTALQKGRLT